MAASWFCGVVKTPANIAMLRYFVSVLQLRPVIMRARAAGADETDRHHDQSSEEGVGG